MNNHLHKTNLYRWMLAVAVAGFLALPLIGSGGLEEQFTPLATVEYETDWTLANAIEGGEVDVDWTLAKEADKDDETDWTLASNDKIHEEEVDWTLA